MNLEIIKKIVLKRQALTALVVLAIIGLAIYANSFNNQLFWDDEDVIINNAYIKDWQYFPKFFSESLISGAGQTSNYWRPLLLVSFSLDYHSWGLNPAGYHFINTLLHLMAAGLAFWLILKISHKSWLSFLTALFFLIHPLNTEAVTYVAGRADPLSTVFMLLTLIFYLDFRQKISFWQSDADTPAPETKSGWYKIILSLGFFIIALLVKEQAVVLPALLIVLELILISRPQEKFFKKICWLAPYIFLALIYLVLHFTLFNFNNLLQGMDYDFSSAYNQSILIRVWTFFKIMLEYWCLLFWPSGLHMAREVAPVLSVFSWPVMLFLAASAGLVVLAVKTWSRDRLIALGLIWYFLLLLPRTNILKINRPMYEHWLYLPMVGLWLALFSLLALVMAKLEAKPGLAKKIKIIGLAVLIIYVLVFSWLTIRRNRDWRDPITFYEKNLRYTPASFIQHNNLGMAYADKQDNERAIKEYRQAIAIKDIYPQVHYNLANSLVAAGQADAAITEYKKAMAMSPGFGAPYQNLLAIYVNRQDRLGAESTITQMKDNLDKELYLMSAGLAEFYFKDFTKALVFWRELLDIEPNNQTVRELINQAKEAMRQNENQATPGAIFNK